MAAGLAVAVAAKASRRRSRFVAGIDLDLPSEVFGVDSSLSSSSSSLAVCLPVLMFASLGTSKGLCSGKYCRSGSCSCCF